MKTRKLRDLTVSAVGMGCMAFSHGYGQIPPEEYSIEAIRDGYNHGCTFFDTALISRQLKKSAKPLKIQCFQGFSLYPKCS